MDPYLEHPRWFPDLHQGLITFLKKELEQRLPPDYYAQARQRVWLDVSQRYVEPDVNVMGEPRGHETSLRRQDHGGVAVAEPEVDADLEVDEPVVITVEETVHDEPSEWFLEIYGKSSGQDGLVTTLEVVSLSNKTPGEEGYDKYRAKQCEVMAGQAHLIEIDLLRTGTHVTAVPQDIARQNAGAFDYHICVHRYDRPAEYQVYPILLARQLPLIAIPLLPADRPVPLDLQAVFNEAYDAGPYRRRIRYGHDPIDPPLRPEQAEWAKTILASSPTDKGR